MASNDKRPRESPEHERSRKKSPPSPRESPWCPKLTRFFSFPAHDEEGKTYWQNLPLDDKRKLYKCGKNYVTLDDISIWPDSQEARRNKPPQGTESQVSFAVNSVLNSKVSLWKGDITRLEIDAIVNAANSSLMGGGGVDGAIHSAAGPSLRSECATLGGCGTGDTKLSTGHRLPAKYILHTVGPMDCDERMLLSCYESCLQLVLEHGIRSVAFCCIATGIFGFPNEDAAGIALNTVRTWLETNNNADKVDRIIFTVFLPLDQKLYSKLLHVYFPLEEQTVNEETVEDEGEEAEDDGTEKEEGRAAIATPYTLQKSMTEPVVLKEPAAVVGTTPKLEKGESEEEEPDKEETAKNSETASGDATSGSQGQEEDTCAKDEDTCAKDEDTCAKDNPTEVETIQQVEEQVPNEAERDKKEMAEGTQTAPGGTTPDEGSQDKDAES